MGEQVYFTGSGETFEGGNRLEHGEQGEVVGPATIESHRGKGEPPPLTAKQLAALQKENEQQAKERAREACQQQLAAAIEAGELEALREAIDAADLAGCSTQLLKQARGRRNALRKTEWRLERQAAAARGEEEARQQRERRAAEAAAEEEQARINSDQYVLQLSIDQSNDGIKNFSRMLNCLDRFGKDLYFEFNEGEVRGINGPAACHRSIERWCHSRRWRCGRSMRRRLPTSTSR